MDAFGIGTYREVNPGGCWLSAAFFMFILLDIRPYYKIEIVYHPCPSRAIVVLQLFLLFLNVFVLFFKSLPGSLKYVAENVSNVISKGVKTKNQCLKLKTHHVP